MDNDRPGRTASVAATHDFGAQAYRSDLTNAASRMGSDSRRW